MPRSPLPTCKHGRCAGRATNGRYCADHAPLHTRKPDTRPSASQRGYDRKWRRVRAQFLKKNPSCIVCGEPATDVDHIVPLADGGTNKWINLQPMCHTHHSQKTAIYDGGFGNERRYGGGM